MVVNDIEEKDGYVRFRGKNVRKEKLERKVKRKPRTFLVIFGNILVIFLLLILVLGNLN